MKENKTKPANEMLPYFVKLIDGLIEEVKRERLLEKLKPSRQTRKGKFY